MNNELFKVREYKPHADRNYILSTWSKGILPEAPFRWMNEEAWKRHHGMMERAVDGDCDILMLVDAQDEDHIIGYCIYSPGILHWAYIKKGSDKGSGLTFRGHGLAKHLITQALPGFGQQPTKYSHQCKAAKAAASRFLASYDPFAFWLQRGAGEAP